MDFDTIANDLAADHGFAANKPSEGGLDDIARQLAIDHDIKTDTKPLIRVLITKPTPPISGASQEESNRINEQLSKLPGKGGGTNLSDVALHTLTPAYEELKSGASTASSGLGDILSNKPATGFGKVGTGLLDIIGSPYKAVSTAATNLTGNEDFGNKVSLVAGGGLPIAKTTNKIISALPRNKALNELVDKITSNGRDPQALVNTIQAMREDNRISPADTSPAVLNMAQKLFTTEGDAAKNHLFNTSKARVANLPQDVTEAYNAAGGVPVNVVQKLSDLAAASKKVGNDLINPAIASAKPVDLTPVIQHINDQIKPGVNQIISQGAALPLSTEANKQLASIRNILTNDKSVAIDAKNLHEFQSALRSEASNLFKSGDPQARKLGYAISQVRNKMVEAIDKSAPGYKEGLSKYKDEKDIAEAFRHAHDDVFSKSTKMENAPEVTEQWFNKLSEHEKEAAREGARLAVRSRMGVSDNASLAGTNLARSEYNQEKLKILFGKEETEKLLKDLENTRAIKNTDQKIIEGSQTEMRRAGDEAIALSKDKPKVEGFGKYIYPAMAGAGEYYTGGSGLAALGTGALATIVKGGSVAKREIIDKLEKERNLHLAKMALPIQGPDRAKLISDLESFLPAPKQSLLTRIINKTPISP